MQWPLFQHQHRLEVLQLECRSLRVSEMGLTILKGKIVALFFFWEGEGGHLRSYLFIHLVHRRKVVHIFQIHIDFDYLLPWWTCSLQDVPEILDALSLWKNTIDSGGGWRRSKNDMFNTVCSLIPPSTIFPDLSAGIWPLKKIRPGTLVAWASVVGNLLVLLIMIWRTSWTDRGYGWDLHSPCSLSFRQACWNQSDW